MSVDARTASRSFGGQAHTPGPRRLYIGAAIMALAIAVIAVIAIAPGGSSSSLLRNAAVLHRPLTKVYGHVPSYIKIPEPNRVPVATATPTHPVLHQEQGYPVVARLPQGSTRIAMAGPQLAGSLAEKVAQHKVSLLANVPGTFTVQFTATHGTVPLSAGSFTILSQEGTIIVPKVRMADGAPLPSTVPAGKTLNLKLYASVPEGDGTIRWAPTSERILVGFFWTTEFD